MDKIIETLSRRYATKVYDTSKKLTPEQLDTLVQAARLSPSSYGLQPYEVLVVLDPEIRKKLRAVSFDQRPVTDASALFVLARYSTFPKGFVDAYIRNIADTRGVATASLERMQETVNNNIDTMTPAQVDCWNRSQTYILLGTLLSAAAAMGIDATPMEGFEPEEYDRILGLDEKKLKATVIMAAGYHSADDYAFGQKKVRRPLDEMVKIIR